MSTNESGETLARSAGAQPIHALIIRSWQRSEEAGIDRDAPPDLRRVPEDDLRRRESDNRLLLDIARPHLRWLSQWFHDRPHVACIVDRDGIVLHAEGDAGAIERHKLSPGYDWSESRMGTSGAGTALTAGVPVAIIGGDHWSTAWKDATCLGAPILGRDGTPLGAIDIHMDVRDGDAARLVIAAHVAYTISLELARHEIEVQGRVNAERYVTMRLTLDAERDAHAESAAALAERKDMETALRLSEVRLQTIIDSMPALVYVVDAAGRFRLINRQFAELFELDPGAVVGRSLFDYFPADVAAQFVANNRRVLESGTVFEFEEAVPLPDGPHTYISVKAPLFGSEGIFNAVCGVSTDITERKRLISALEGAQRQKDAMIATVAHELRQPLGAIQAALAMMRAHTSREAGERARKVVERQVTQLTRLVEDLFDASRIAQGKVLLQFQRLTLNSIIDAAVTTAQPLLHDRDQHLDVQLSADDVWLDADAARLQQVLSNLLTNASKFTGAGGRISLSVALGQESVAISVKDSGQGIAADCLPHIFDLFSQAQPDARGLGIGLALVRGLVEGHGGTVDAISEGPGMGSEFVVRLPRVPAPA